MVGRAGRYDAAPRANLGCPARRRGILGGVAEQSVDIPRPDILALADARIKLFQHVTCGLTGFRGAGEGNHIAVGLRLDAEALLEQGQMPIVFAEQPVQVPVVLERHDYTRLRSSHLLAQTRGRWPSNASQVAGLLKNRRIARTHVRHPSTIPGSRHQAGTVSPT